MTRLKTENFGGIIQCPKCGSKCTNAHIGIRSAYFRFYCCDCCYEFKAEPKPFEGIIVTKNTLEVIGKDE